MQKVLLENIKNENYKVRFQIYENNKKWKKAKKDKNAKIRAEAYIRTNRMYEGLNDKTERVKKIINKYIEKTIDIT